MSVKAQKEQRLITLGLIALVLFSVILGFTGLCHQGLVHDDTAYFQGARTTLMVIHWLGEGKPQPLAAYAEQHGMYEPISPIWAKPFWHITTVTLLAIFGEQDTPLFLFNGLLGILLVLFFYRFLITRFATGKWQALLSASFITTLGVFVILRRSGMAEVFGMFLFTAGMYVAFPKKVQKLREVFWGAALLALSIFTHPMFIPYVGGFFLFTQLVGPLKWDRKKVRSILRYIGVYILSFVCVFAVLDAPFIAMRGALSPADRAYFTSRQQEPFPEIYAQLYDHFFCCSVDVTSGEMGEVQIKTNDLSTGQGLKRVTESYGLRFAHEYGYDFWVMNGLLIMVLIPVLVFILLRPKKKTPWLKHLGSTKPLWIMFVCLLPMLFYSVPPMIPGNRNLFPGLVFILFFSGEEVLRWLSVVKRPVFRLSIIVLLLLVQFYAIQPVFSARSGLREVARWLTAHGRNSVYILNVPTLMNAAYILNSYGIQVIVANDVRYLPYNGYLLVRLRNSYFISPETNPAYRENRMIAERARPVLRTEEVPHIHALDFAKRADSPFIDRMMQLVLKRNVKREHLPILLFDLRSVPH